MRVHVQKLSYDHVDNDNHIGVELLIDLFIAAAPAPSAAMKIHTTIEAWSLIRTRCLH